MRNQFFGKPFLLTLALLTGVFGLAILVFQTPFTLPVLFIITMVVFGITIWKLEFGIAIAFAELFANSHGHLLSVPIGPIDFSSRMAVFVAVMSGWLILFLIGRVKVSFKDLRLQPFLFLVSAVIIGFIVGVGGNDLKNVFSDGNAYLYLAYLLPILSIEWTASRRRLLLQVLAASATWVIILTLGTLFVFTHVEPIHLPGAYRFLRDTRTAEITRQGETSIFRIFLQAQFSIAVFSILTWMLLWKIKYSNLLLFSLSLMIAALLISMSRSFAIGIFIGGLVLVVLIIWVVQPQIKKTLTVGITTIIAGILGFAILAGVIFFPWPQQFGSFDDLGIFVSRAGGDVAISSRWNLLPPLMDEIYKQPVFGSGFGKEVEFITDDPRIRSINPDGKYRTYSLEWGWQEIWLKMGIFGLVAFGWVLVAAIKGLWPMLKTEKAWLGIGLISALIMLYTIQIFSPYLNHPLGLGLILLTVPFWCETKKPLGIKVLTKDSIFIPKRSQVATCNADVLSSD